MGEYTTCELLFWGHSTAFWDLVPWNGHGLTFEGPAPLTLRGPKGVLSTEASRIRDPGALMSLHFVKMGLYSGG